MRTKIFRTVLLLWGVLAGVQAWSQGVGEPTFHSFRRNDGATVRTISDNGKWAVFTGQNENDMEDYANLVDLSTDKGVDLRAGGVAAALDVSDDGTVVVGISNGQPAVWMKSTGKWAILPVPSDCAGGMACSVTPDGKWAVGRTNRNGSLMLEVPVLWDLSAGGKITETPNIPTRDMGGRDLGMSRFNAISADGRYILGCLSYSYLQPRGCCYYRYDRETQTYNYIGFDVNKDYTERDLDDESENFDFMIPRVEDLWFIGEAYMSNNGRYVTGIACLLNESSEYNVPCLYDGETDEFIVYDESEDRGQCPFSCDNTGHVFAATPEGNPAREWSVRVDQHWFTLRQILKQRYHKEYTEFENTGTPVGLSSDAKVIGVLVYPQGESYVLELPESVDSAVAGIDLMAEYTVSPAEGAEVGSLNSVSVRFDRDVEVVAKSNEATLNDAEGNLWKNSVGFRVGSDGKTVTVNFRAASLEDGKDYTVVIPAGSIVLKGDTEKKCKEITLHYKGRAGRPMKATDVAPASGTSLSMLNFSTNPILMTFDGGVALTDSAEATLYMSGEASPVCGLEMAVSSLDDKLVAVYPAAGQYLYKGSEYHVTIKVGSLTDVSGQNPNEEIGLDYTGAYERETHFDDVTLFKDDFSSALGGFMLYDGDHLEPSEEAVKWGFDATNTPWGFVADDVPAEDGSWVYAAGSHSMYRVGGRSDDWMVTTQIYIPSNKCTLTWESQSYRNDKKDSLKVIVWEHDPVLNVLTKETVDKMKAEGKVVYAGLETPGKSETLMAGDWTQHVVDLAEYKGKNVYIAFLNDNENQSAVFVDNVEVTNNQNFLVGLKNDMTVVNQTEVSISGTVSIHAAEQPYTSVNVVLADASGAKVDEKSESGLSLKTGDTYEFAFAKPLPLTPGKANKFTVNVTLDEEEKTTEYTIKDLTFEPEKRIAIEEYTGMTCVNCPLGIVAMEKLETLFPDKVIPICYHVYPGDPLTSSELEYYASMFLGLNAAPSAVVNRQGGTALTTTFPMVTVEVSKDVYDYVFTNGDGTCWQDRAEVEFNTPAEAELSVKAEYRDGKIVVPCTYKYALDASGLNVGLFSVILEDNVTGYQTSNVSALSDPDLGEWGLGGKYASQMVAPYVFNDVARKVTDTYFGELGLVSAEVKAGEEYTATLELDVPSNVADLSHCKVAVMMIDANTGNVINAARADKIEGAPSGIGSAEADAADVSVRVSGGAVHVSVHGTARVTLYGADGTMIARETVEGEGILPLQGRKGVVLAEVVAEDGSRTVKKVLAK